MKTSTISSVVKLCILLILHCHIASSFTLRSPKLPGTLESASDPVVAARTDNEDNSLFCAVLNPITGTYIDLSQLSSTPNTNRLREGNSQFSHPAKTKWIVKGWGPDAHKNFTIGICSCPVSTERERQQLSNTTGAFFVDDNSIDEFVSIGDFSTKPLLFGGADKKLTLKYTNGSLCPNAVDRRSTLLNFVCDKELTTKAKISYLGSLNDCSYIFEVRSIYACPTSNKKNEVNVLGIFFGIFLVFLGVEILRRMIYRRLRLRRPGGVLRGHTHRVYRDHDGSVSDGRYDNTNVVMYPNWDAFENTTLTRRIGRSLVHPVRGVVRLLAGIFGGTGRRESAGAIRLDTPSFPSTSSSSFIRDMETQNNILDSLEIGASNESSESLGRSLRSS